VGSLASGKVGQSDEVEGRDAADADTRGREWQRVARVGKQREVANRPTQSDRDRGQRDHVSRCRMGSLAGFHCRAGAGPGLCQGWIHCCRCVFGIFLSGLLPEPLTVE